jgi:hypothetical protein
MMLGEIDMKNDFFCWRDYALETPIRCRAGEQILDRQGGSLLQ